MTSLRSLAAPLLATFAMLVAAAPADATAKRVVALEWDAVENLSTLGITPVGAADLKGYDKFVAVKRRGKPTDVGLRQSPSLDRIRRLKPDLIIVPDYRSSRNLSALREIATVLVTKPYPGGTGDAQYNAMIRDYRRVAKAVGRRAQGERVIKRMTTAFGAVKRQLKAKKRSGISLTIATPGGTTSSPALRMSTGNSQTAGVLRRIGLKNGWNAGNPRYGFTTVGIGALARIKTGWLAFVYTTPYKKQIQSFQKLPAFKKLPVMKKKRYRNLEGRTWLFGGPASARLIALQVGASLRRG